jgi:predicted Zn-dependent protease
MTNAFAMFRRSLLLLLAPLVMTASFSCSKDGDVNTFTVQDDIKLGQDVKQRIESNPQKYPILSPSEHAEAYDYMGNMVDKILQSDEILHRDQFKWEFKIIQDDSTLNAFAAPGGYIYVYTGLIKFLEEESDLAGVLAHEIAHADRRHSTDQLTKINGVNMLLSAVLGDESAVKNITTQLVGLKFSRDMESEADEFSVKYLCDTEYDAAGAAGFFQKLEAQGQGGNVPQFLSTHPAPDNRIEAIKDQKEAANCPGDGPSDEVSEYDDFKALLP